MSAPVERLIHEGRQLGARENAKGERIMGWPEQAYLAVRGINHLTNTELSIPAPVVYRTLGDLKMAVRALPQALQQLSDGLNRSIDSPTMRVYDDRERGPKASVDEATALLTMAAMHVSQAADLLDKVQVAINQQGYEEVEDDR